MDDASVEQYASGPLAELFAQGVGHGGVSLVLQAIRKHLGMDVAFVSHFREDDRVLEAVDANPGSPIFAGQVVSLEEGYCRRIVCGELPQLIVDTSKNPVAMQIPITASLPIGSHLSVPIVLENGLVYGTLCCFSYQPDLTLGDRDLKMMMAFAEVLASRIGEGQETAEKSREQVSAVRKAIASGKPRLVYQPLYELSTGKLSMLECLSRFDGVLESPDQWFHMAYRVGLGRELELAALRKALDALTTLPSHVCIAVNASPELVISGEFSPLFDHVEPSRVVLEITEHAIVADYKQLAAALRPLKERGLKLAIDDAGAGYASMRHIVDLHPDLVKLDMSLTRNIDTDSKRRALARALISFTREIGCEISAEGVETEDELRMLQWLGVDQAQGFFLGRPMALENVLQLQPANEEARHPCLSSELQQSAA